jgi:hypothetical protein
VLCTPRVGNTPTPEYEVRKNFRTKPRKAIFLRGSKIVPVSQVGVFAQFSFLARVLQCIFVSNEN